MIVFRDVDTHPAKHDIMPLGSLAVGPSWMPSEERAESSESDSGASTDSDSDDGDTRMPRLVLRHSSPAPCDALSTIDGMPLALPQRPNTALTRNTTQSWRHRFLVRSAPKCAAPTHLTPIANHGLRLAPAPRVPEKVLHAQKTPHRSEDRIRAAQRLFRALGHSHRRASAGLSSSRSRPHMSVLSSLSAQARRRHSRSHDILQPSEHVELTPTINGTQQCMIFTEEDTFELVVTPPTPKADSGEEFSPFTPGVRFASSHKSQALTPPAPQSSPTLEPPPFEIAPGRVHQVAERRKQAAQLALAHELLRTKGVFVQNGHVIASREAQKPVLQPMVNSSQSHTEFVSPTRDNNCCASSPLGTSVKPGAGAIKYVPPRRRHYVHATPSAAVQAVSLAP